MVVLNFTAVSLNDLLLQMNALKCRTLSAMRARTLKTHTMRMRAFCRKMADRTYAYNGAMLDLCNGAVSEKALQIF